MYTTTAPQQIQHHFLGIAVGFTALKPTSTSGRGAGTVCGRTGATLLGGGGLEGAAGALLYVASSILG